MEIPEIAVSGLVHVSHLSHKFVKFSEDDHSFSAPGGLRWKIGDAMKVRVSNVDFRQRRIDFIPVGIRFAFRRKVRV